MKASIERVLARAWRAVKPRLPPAVQRLVFLLRWDRSWRARWKEHFVNAPRHLLLVTTKLCIVTRGIATGRRRVWLFTAWEGRAFSDNPKHMFLYVQKYMRDVRPVWISCDKAVVAYLRARGLSAVVHDSPQAALYSSMAEAFFWSDTPVLGRHMCPTGLNVNLWHGMPMKCLGKIRMRFDFAIATSTGSQALLSEVFSTAPDSVVICGQPKNDVLFTQVPRPAHMRRWGDKSRVVTYMPTYRGVFNNKPAVSRDNRSGIMLDACLRGRLRSTLERMLQQYDLVLAIKPHIRNRMEDPRMDRVLVLDEFQSVGAALDSHELMSITDILITDYSSVYFDYLLTERPFIIYAPDLVVYTAEQRLYYDMHELSGGSLATDEEDLLRRLVQYAEDADIDRDRRQELNRRFNAVRDGRSAERVAMEVAQRLATRATARR